MECLNRKKLLILGAGEFQKPLIMHAVKNYDVVLIAPEISDELKKLVKSYFISDVRDVESALKIAEMEKIDGVISDQTDIPVYTCAYVAEKMGLPGIGSVKGRLFTDKSLMRKRLMELNIPVIPFKTVTKMEEALDFFKENNGQLMIIKPVDSQGSRGVQVCDSESSIREKFPEAKKWSFSGEVVIEKYIKGIEFVVEGLAYDGKFENLVIGDTYYFDLPDAFAAKRRLFPSDRNQELVDRVLERNKDIIQGFGLSQGITHSEYIVDGEEIYLIETAARGGGVFISSDIISICTGVCVEEFLENIAVGERIDIPKAVSTGMHCGYMACYLPEGELTMVEGISDVSTLPYVHRNQLVGLKKGDVVKGGHSDKTTRKAIIVSAGSRKELLGRMADIQKRIKIRAVRGGREGGLIWK